MTYAHPITQQMEGFWHDHAGRYNDPQWREYLESFAGLFGLKMAELGEEHSNEGRFGMSRAGGCTRAASLKFLGYDGELSGSSRATFAIGHMVEVMALATLRAIGFPLSNVQGRASIDPFMTSAIDAETLLDGVPTHLSVKSVGYKMSGYNFKARTWKRFGFAQYPMDGVRATSPGYWAQAQAEMYARDAQQTLFVIVAKDMIKKMEGDPLLVESGSLTFYCELVQLEPQFVTDTLIPTWREQWDAVGIGDAGPALFLRKDGVYVNLTRGAEDANKAATGTYDPCSYCDLYDACGEHAVNAQLVGSLKAVANA